jgi:26S proteasome regulatory subunit N10
MLPSAIIATAAWLRDCSHTMSSCISQGEAGGGFEFGVDANLDPELALALRVSLEEERARQQTGGASCMCWPH